MKLTDFGAASPSLPLSKEDERSAVLAARAQKGDYDDGIIPALRFLFAWVNQLQNSSSNSSHEIVYFSKTTD